MQARLFITTIILSTFYKLIGFFEQNRKFVTLILSCIPIVWIGSARAQEIDSITIPGANIQRTMQLLEGSTPGKSNTVKILFYGQSITEGEWTRIVAEDLRKRYPFANLIIENRAIGGFTAPALIKMAEYDLYPQYPDLLIFHVYGGDEPDGMLKYEEIVQQVRARTCSEIILTTHHGIGRSKDYADSEIIRKIAKKYSCGLIDIERLWNETVKNEKLNYKDLLADHIHMNAAGNKLYAGFISRFLKINTETSNIERTSQGNISFIPYRNNEAIKYMDDGSIEFNFTGNRIDVIPEKNISAYPMAEVFIDGRKPSDFKEAYSFTRPSRIPYGWMPAFKSLSSIKPVLVEDWTLNVLDIPNNDNDFQYEVIGSLTGYDGKGSNTELFTSNSGRVVIEGGDNWGISSWINYNSEYNKKEIKIPEGFKVMWSVVPHFLDVLEFPQSNYNGTENAVNLIQCISNGPHILKLVPLPGVKLEIKGFRVYQPVTDTSIF